jgi:hypothetical protein
MQQAATPPAKAESPAEAVDLELEDDRAALLPDSKEGAGQLIEQYVRELRAEIAAGVQPPPEGARARRFIWALGLGSVAGALLVFAVLWQHTRALSAAVQGTARYEQSICMARQMRVMQAIADYTRDHHDVPPDLASLGPPYLQVPAADPTSGLPFTYGRESGVAWLTCREHPLAPQQQTPRAFAEASSPQPHPQE